MSSKKYLTLFLAFLWVIVITAVGCGGTECKDDASCGAGKTCVEGKCQAKATTGCKADADCKAPKGKCDTAKKECVECLKNEDCGSDKECIKNACQAKTTEGCKSDDDCKDKSMKFCSDQKKCEWACKAEADCADGEECQDHTCKAKATEECKADDDCKTKPMKFCSDQKRCEWACKADGDCAKDEKCDAHKCIKNATGCKTNTDCNDKSKPKCDTGSGQCVECLADADCTDASKNKCVQNVCKAAGTGCANCQGNEFCFANEKCLKKPTSCKSSKDCQSSEVCVKIGSVSFCLNKCNPTKNTSSKDLHNSGCWSGYGLCYPLSSATSGACVPPAKKTQDKGNACGVLSKPQDPSFHDCKSPYLCKENKCVEATQNDGDICNKTDKFCKEGMYCLSFDSTKKISLCKKQCNPKVGGCKADFTCEGVSSRDPSLGACIETRKENRAKGDSCEGKDPRDASWHKCTNAAPCVKNVCGEPRQKKRDKGESCDLNDISDPGYHSCKTGLLCHSHVCTASCDPTGSSTCAATEKCIAPSSKKPKEGICQSLQGLKCSPKSPCPSPYFCFKFNYANYCVKPCDPTASTTSCPTDHTCQAFDLKDPKKGYCIQDRLHRRAKGESCSFSRPEDPAYHLCKKPLVCISLSCVDAPPATGKEGEACNSKKGCVSPLVCTRNDTGKDVCARFCNPYKTGQCKTGEACIMKQKDKFYWQGGCFKARTKTQSVGDECLKSDTSKPEYNDCAKDAVCVNNWCHEECKVGSTTCPSTHECKKHGTSGYCSLKLKKTRKFKEECLNADEKDPAYHDCITNYSCLTFDRDKNLKLCMANCNPKSPQCSSGLKCVGISSSDPTKGACIPENKKTRKKGETCGSRDPRDPAWDDCITGLGCGGGKCITPTQTQGQKCDYEKALVCKDKLICVGAGSGDWCLDTCDPKASTCPSGYKCAGLSGGGGACLKTCTTDKDCTYGACKTIGSMGKVCI